MKENSAQSESDLFNELMRRSLFRAKVCEEVAKLNGKQNYSEYFLIGLFSLIDSLLRRPMNMILQKLPFSEEIAETISGGETAMSPYLAFSVALSKVEWDKVEKYGAQLGLSEQQILEIQQKADEWVEETFQ